jgi:hypothetical protein
MTGSLPCLFKPSIKYEYYVVTHVISFILKNILLGTEPTATYAPK